MRLIRIPHTLMLSVIIAMVTLCAVLLLDLRDRHSPDPTAAVQTPTRDEINAAVGRLVQAGRAQELYAFYAQDVGDPIKAMLYTSAAITNHAPVNLVISVGWFEGGHLVGLVTGNTNGSVDVSPMGLNSISYRKYSVAQLSRLEFNIPQGWSTWSPSGSGGRSAGRPRWRRTTTVGLTGWMPGRLTTSPPCSGTSGSWTCGSLPVPGPVLDGHVPADRPHPAAPDAELGLRVPVGPPDPPPGVQPGRGEHDLRVPAGR